MVTRKEFERMLQPTPIKCCKCNNEVEFSYFENDDVCDICRFKELFPFYL